MKFFLTSFGIAALLLIGVGVPSRASAVPCDPEINNCGTGVLDFSYSNLTPTSQGFSVTITSISVGHPLFAVYACIGPATTCTSAPVTSSLHWKLLPCQRSFELKYET
jgi:hypothetical protein